MVAVPRIMQDGKTPAQWVDELAARGIEMPARPFMGLNGKLRSLEIWGCPIDMCVGSRPALPIYRQGWPLIC